MGKCGCQNRATARLRSDASDLWIFDGDEQLDRGKYGCPRASDLVRETMHMTITVRRRAAWQTTITGPSLSSTNSGVFCSFSKVRAKHHMNIKATPMEQFPSSLRAPPRQSSKQLTTHLVS